MSELTIDQAVEAAAASETVSAPALRITVIIIAVYAALALALMPFARIAGPEMPGINAFFAAGVFVTELATAFLIWTRFREIPAWSLLPLGCAYLYSALMAIPYLLTFPGAMLAGRPIVGTAQSSAWIFIPWIVGYALLTLIAVVLEARFGERRVAPSRIARATMIAAGAVLAAVGSIAASAILLVDRLPPLIGGSGWTGLDIAASTAAVAMLACGVAIILLAIRQRNDLFLWLTLALTAMAFANILATAGGGRYTLGWSVCRLSWLASACALFLYFMVQFVRQQSLLWRTRAALEQRVHERTADLTAMVSQRDLLLREVHHRVKNNFQVVNSLIHFQSSHSQSEETRDALDNLHRRVYALGLVHQQLMQLSNLASFDVRSFLDDLCANLATWSDANRRGIKVTAEADALQTDLDAASPLGLLVTELVTSAFARFPPGHTGSIAVALRRGTPETVALTVSDTGGIEQPPLSLDARDHESRIMKALVMRVRGEFTSTHDNGTTTVTVILPHAKKD